MTFLLVLVSEIISYLTVDKPNQSFISTKGLHFFLQPGWSSASVFGLETMARFHGSAYRGILRLQTIESRAFQAPELKILGVALPLGNWWEGGYFQIRCDFKKINQ